MPSTEEAQAQKEKEKRNKNQKAELEWSGVERTSEREGIYTLPTLRSPSTSSHKRTCWKAPVPAWMTWIRWEPREKQCTSCYLQVNAMGTVATSEPTFRYCFTCINQEVLYTKGGKLHAIQSRSQNESFRSIGLLWLSFDQKWSKLGSRISFMSHKKMSTKWRHMRLNNDANMGNRPLRIRCNLELSDRGRTDRDMM